MGLRFVFAVAAAISATSTAAEMPLDKMELAIGLAKIIHNADRCGFSINQDALEKYMAAQKLDDPEHLAFIASVQSTEELDEDRPTASMCTMSRATAKRAGLAD